MKLILTSVLMLLTLSAFAGANEITPDAEKLLGEVTAANAKLNSISLEGAVSGEFDVAGMKDSYSKKFESTWIAGGPFRLQVPDEVVIGSTGEKLFQFSPKDKMYMQMDAKAAPRELPSQVHPMLIAQDLQLLLAGHAESADLLKKTFTSIKTGNDESIGATQYKTLVFENDERVMIALFDPSTQMLRQVRTDPTKMLTKRGATAINKAQVTVDYTKVEPNAPLKPEQFAWTPPAGARDVADQAGAAGEGEAKALEGKPAPAFVLKSLEDKDVSLTDQKGKVVVLDFWATWCGPCVASLPGLDKLAKEHAKDNVIVFAVNQQEEKDVVQAFVEKTKLGLPVLMDVNSTVSNEYKITGLPTTVLIGKDGVIRKVMVGVSPKDGHRPLEEAIAAELKK